MKDIVLTSTTRSTQTALSPGGSMPCTSVGLRDIIPVCEHLQLTNCIPLMLNIPEP